AYGTGSEIPAPAMAITSLAHWSTLPPTVVPKPSSNWSAATVRANSKPSLRRCLIFISAFRRPGGDHRITCFVVLGSQWHRVNEAGDPRHTHRQNTISLTGPQNGRGTGRV